MPEAIFVHGCHGNGIAWFASLRSKEVVIGKSARGHFFMVFMEMLKYTCVPSFTSMHCMVCKFEK